jgi:type I thyroxine 5'-deiodinase
MTDVDGLDYAVESAYTAWPTRVYVIGKDGKIRYKSRPLLMGMQVEEIDRLLAREIRSR